MSETPKIFVPAPEFTLAGRRVELNFDMPEWRKIEKEICLIDDMGRALTEAGRVDALPRLAAILAHDPAVTPEWIFEHMHPADFRVILAAVNAAVAKGFAMETEKGEGGIVDAVLEEIEKNGNEGN